MPINVNQAIDSQTGERIKILRSFAGRFVDGIYVEGTTKIIKALASQQVATPEMIELFTGLERDKDVKVFFVNKAIITSSEYDDQEADRIIWKGKTYRTMRSEDWSSYGYNVVIGARIE